MYGRGGFGPQLMMYYGGPPGGNRPQGMPQGGWNQGMQQRTPMMSGGFRQPMYNPMNQMMPQPQRGQGKGFPEGGRRQGQPQTRPQAPQPQAAQQGRSGPSTEPLTSEMLAQANPSQQKQMIGERIFPKIQHREPKLAGKITGMLLEMDNMELLHLLEDEKALMSKINEALLVLNSHSTNDMDNPAAE